MMIPSFNPTKRASVVIKNSENGFTLIELLVYMLMSAIVVTIAAQVWMSFTKSAKKTSDRMGVNLEIEQVLYYLAEDISRVGTKSNTTETGMETNSDMYMSTTDSSSFSHIQNGTTDTLIFKTAIYDDDDSEYLGFEVVTYNIDEKKLQRSVVFTDVVGAVGAGVVTTMVDSVTGFDFSFGVYSSEGENDELLGEVTSMVNTDIADFTHAFFGGTALTITSSATTDFVDITNFTIGDSCMIAVNESGSRKTFNDNAEGFKAGKTYKLTFNTIVDQTFADSFDLSNDTMFVLLRKASTNWNNTGGVPIYYFYPGLPTSPIEREFVFTPSEDVDEPSFYVGLKPDSDISAGVLSLGPMMIEEVSDMQYNWTSEFTGTAAEASLARQNTRAISLELTVEHDNAADEYDRTYTLKKFIQLPNNGVR